MTPMDGLWHPWMGPGTHGWAAGPMGGPWHLVLVTSPSCPLGRQRSPHTAQRGVRLHLPARAPTQALPLPAQQAR